jgi:hypothetical protein
LQLIFGHFKLKKTKTLKKIVAAVRSAAGSWRRASSAGSGI